MGLEQEDDDDESNIESPLNIDKAMTMDRSYARRNIPHKPYWKTPVQADKKY